jgi:hypothetical protein
MLIDEVGDDDSLEAGQRINHRHFRVPDSLNSNNNDGMRNFHMNNPFSRTFVIVNDIENDEDQGHLNYYSLAFD